MNEDPGNDCRAVEGITVGLIDSLIAIARVLKDRDLESSLAVKEAIVDLRSDEDIKFIMEN